MLILGSASHLDAFSAYPNPTSLPGNALGRTTGTQEVGPSWSSRTKDESPQHSAPVVDRRPTICYLHNRFQILMQERGTPAGLNLERTLSPRPMGTMCGQTFRAISTGKLKPLLALHAQPINRVVFPGPSWRSRFEGGFPLRCFQRLSLPHVATQRVPLAR